MGKAAGSINHPPERSDRLLGSFLPKAAPRSRLVNQQGCNWQVSRKGAPGGGGGRSCLWRRGCSEEASLEYKNTLSPVLIESTRSNVTFPWLTLYHPAIAKKLWQYVALRKSTQQSYLCDPAAATLHGADGPDKNAMRGTGWWRHHSRYTCLILLDAQLQEARLKDCKNQLSYSRNWVLASPPKGSEIMARKATCHLGEAMTCPAFYRKMGRNVLPSHGNQSPLSPQSEQSQHTSVQDLPC